MDWKRYAGCLVGFGLAGTLLLYAVLRLQPLLHTFDPAFRPGPLAPDLAMNTAISFATTTTWQAYGGESTMSYLSQVFGLTSQNFLAGAAGLAVGMAFIRGLSRQHTNLLGNFWVDVTRATLWVLLPLAVLSAPVLVWQGVPMNFAPYAHVAIVQPVGYDEPVTGPDGKPVLDEKGQPKTRRALLTVQVIPMGPVAALETIKNLGTNGGGFFNVNAAHPFENPTPLTNFLELLAIVVLPASLTYAFGRMTGHPAQGWVRSRRVCSYATWPSSAATPWLPRGWTTRRVNSRPVATWRARRSVSGSGARCWPRSPPRTARPAPTTRCTTATPRSAGS